MMGSDHPKAVSLRRQIKSYSVQQQKALSSATSNLTGIEFSSELIRLVEESEIGELEVSGVKGSYV